MVLIGLLGQSNWTLPLGKEYTITIRPCRTVGLCQEPGCLTTQPSEIPSKEVLPVSVLSVVKQRLISPNGCTCLVRHQSYPRYQYESHSHCAFWCSRLPNRRLLGPRIRIEPSYAGKTPCFDILNQRGRDGIPFRESVLQAYRPFEFVRKIEWAQRFRWVLT